MNHDIDAVISSMQDEFIDFLRGLLRIPSVAEPPNGEEGASQHYLADKLQSLGLDVDLFQPDEVPNITEHPLWNPAPKDYTDRPNAVSVWKGSGGGRSLLITSHVDVVPLGPLESWEKNGHGPWDADMEEGVIYGRGAVDVKGGLACLVGAIEALKKVGIQPKGDVTFASVVDEEHGGMNGSLAVVAKEYTADATVLIEPTDMVVCPGTQGGQQIYLYVRGKGVFLVDKHLGVDAIDKMYLVRKELLQLELNRNAEFQNEPLLCDLPLPATVNIQTIKGGDMTGQVADLCSSYIWYTANPGETEAKVMGEFQAALDAAAANDEWLQAHPAETEVYGKFLDPCSTPLDSPIIGSMHRAIEQVGLPIKPLQYMKSGCDLSRFVLPEAGNMPGVVFGPGDASTAHTSREQVKVEDLMNTVRVMAHTIIDWCGVS
jgi:acetylornithine deacetylase